MQPFDTERVRELRGLRMLSQQELADRAGVSLFTIQRIERGEGSVRPRTGRSVARALEVPIEELLPKAQAPLPFEEELSGQRRSPFLEAWTEYLRRRARAWEKAIEEEGVELFGEPEFVFDALLRCEQVQTEAAMLMAAVTKAVLPDGPEGEEAKDLAAAGAHQRAELGEAFLEVMRAADNWSAAADAAWRRAGDEVQRRKLARARERAERAIRERENLVPLFEKQRSA